MSPYAIMLEIASRIREKNLSSGPDYIPSSDSAHKKLFASIVDTDETFVYYMRMLKDAHYIFVIKLVEPDDKLMIQGIDGYISAEVSVIAKMKERSFHELEAAYEHQFYKRKPASSLTRELLTEVRRYNNTPLGRALNLSIMLQQYEQIMASQFSEFTDSWKKNKLQGLVPNSGGPVAGPEPHEEDLSEFSGMQIKEPGSKRAVDSREIASIEAMDRSGKWGEAVSKFGTEFLLRIHFRKYEFEKVKYLIRTKKIAAETDLRYIRDTIRKMEERTGIDPALLKYKQQMSDVKRAAQMRLNEIIIAKKPG